VLRASIIGDAHSTSIIVVVVVVHNGGCALLCGWFLTLHAVDAL